MSPKAIRPGAAFRGRAREHPISPFGNERCKRRPGQSGAGRVSPSREAAPAQAWEQLWTLGALPPNTSQGPLHILKGMVPEAAAHVPFVVCGRCVGGSAAQRRSSTAASACMRRWQLACDYTMLATELASDFDSLCSSWKLACDFSSRYALLCLCCCYVPMFVCLQLACDLSMCCARSVFEFDLIDRIRSWTWCRSPFAALVTCRRRSARRAEYFYHTRIIILENGRSVKNARAQNVAKTSTPQRLRQESLHLRLKDSTGLSARTHQRLLISTELVVRKRARARACVCV